MPHIELSQLVLFTFLPVCILVFPNTVGPVLYFFPADVTGPFLAAALVCRMLNMFTSVFPCRNELVAVRTFLARGSIAEHEEAKGNE